MNSKVMAKTSAPGGYYSPETGDWVDLAEPLDRCVEGSFVLHEGEEIMQLGSSAGVCWGPWELRVGGSGGFFSG